MRRVLSSSRVDLELPPASTRTTMTVPTIAPAAAIATTIARRRRRGFRMAGGAVTAAMSAVEGPPRGLRADRQRELVEPQAVDALGLGARLVERQEDRAFEEAVFLPAARVEADRVRVDRGVAARPAVRQPLGRLVEEDDSDGLHQLDV